MRKLLCIIAFSFTAALTAQNRFDNVEIITHEVAEQVYMLEGSGGNILIRICDNAVVMIDSQFAPLSDKLRATIEKLTDQPLKYLINTHHHGDHTGGNENFNSDEVTLIAHENVWSRMKEAGKAEAFLPEKTLEEKYELEMPDEQIMILHVHHAHTDGDSFIYMLHSNVVHMGDVFFNGRYPYIDLDSGGSISGYIEAQERVLSTINPDTKIVPGHGPLGTYDDLAAYLPMLIDLRDQIQMAIDKGKSRSYVEKDASITEKYDASGYGDGFINSEKIRATIYDSLVAENARKK